MIKKLFNAEQIVNGLFGATGAPMGVLGKQFGKQGGKYGVDNSPKYDPTDYFNAESYFQFSDHFDPKRLFDPDKIANQILQKG